MARAFVFVVLLSLVAVACSRTLSPGTVPALGPGMRSRPNALPTGKITHIVFVIQENRTFDNIFGGPKPFPNATATAGGETLTGPIPLTRQPLEGGDDPNNYHREWLQACNPRPDSGPPFKVGAPAPCQMNGFNVAASPSPGYTPPASVKAIYSYVDYDETKPYWDIAAAYALGDHFFMGHNSESFTAHQYLFSAQSNNMVDAPVYPQGTKCGWYYDYCAFTPWGCDSPPETTTFHLDPKTGEESKKPGPFPCFGQGGPNPEVRYPALASRVEEKGLTWRFYAHSLCSDIVGIDVNASIRYGALWPKKPNMADCHDHESAFFPTHVDTENFRVPQDTFLHDVADSRRTLANVTWILPGPITSDHPGVPFGYCGPWWVSKIVDAIGESKYWNSTVIFVLWDDWGGFYDHVPPYVVRDQEGPGFRVPLLVVSPYAKHNHVAHTQTEFATLIKFAEETLGLASLDATDKSPYLNDLNDFFQPNPQPFTKIKVPHYYLCNLPLERKRREVLTRSRWLRMIGDD
jgi:phospholipase C